MFFVRSLSMLLLVTFVVGFARPPSFAAVFEETAIETSHLCVDDLAIDEAESSDPRSSGPMDEEDSHDKCLHSIQPLVFPSHSGKYVYFEFPPPMGIRSAPMRYWIS